MVITPNANAGGMAEWLKAAVLKTVVRKYRGFESYFLRHIVANGEVTELADGARLLSECGGHTPPRVRIPPSPPVFVTRPTSGFLRPVSICELLFVIVCNTFSF